MLTRELRAAVRAEFSDLRPADLDRARTLGRGESAVALLVGDVVVRVPTGTRPVLAPDTEARLLAALETRGVPFVPRDARTLLGRDGAPIAMAYRYIDGVPARGISLRGDARERFACDLGTFLGALHKVPPATARRLGVPAGDYWRRTYAPLLEACRPHLDARLWGELERLIEESAPLLARAPRALVHADISGMHTLLDADGHLAGVIDFGEAGVADPAIDFAGVLNDRSRSFLARVLAHYPLPLDRDAPARAEFFIALAPLFTIRTAVEDGDAETLAQAVGTLRRRVRLAMVRGAGGP